MRSVEVEQPDGLARLGAEIGADIGEGRLTLPVLPNVAAEGMASSVDERADAARLAALQALPGMRLLDLYPEDHAALLDRHPDIDAAVTSMVL